MFRCGRHELEDYDLPAEDVRMRGPLIRELRHNVAEVDQLHLISDVLGVIGDRPELVTVELLEARRHGLVAAQDAGDCPTTREEAFGMLQTQHVRVLVPRRFGCRKLEQIDDYGVLPDGFRPTAPVDEFGLRDPAVRHEIVVTTRVASSERQRFDFLVPPENVRKRYKNSDGVDDHVDLAGEAFDGDRSDEHGFIDAVHRDHTLCSSQPLSLEACLDRGDPGGEILPGAVPDLLAGVRELESELAIPSSTSPLRVSFATPAAGTSA